MTKWLDPNVEYANPAYVGGCGYPLCPYYNEKDSPPLECPFPIQGSPCQGIIEAHENSIKPSE
jgi:hypothetical protein